MKRKVKISIIVLFLLNLLSKATFAQGKILAKIGDRKITAQEFKRRFELTPEINNRKTDEEKEKNYLYSLIAEKLWALEAENEGFGKSKIMRETFKSIERMYVRDAIYRREIKSKVKVSKTELLDALNKYHEILFVKYILSSSEKEILKIYRQIKNGGSFDSILKKRKEYSAQEKPVEFEFGRLDKEAEDKIFKLKNGEVSKPLKILGEWAIVKLYGSKKRIFKTRKREEKAFSEVKKIVTQRKEELLENEFFKKYFKDKKLTANGKLFWSISNALVKILLSEKQKNKIPDGEKVELQSADYNEFVKLLTPDTLKMKFINFKKNPLTVDDFLRSLFFEGFYTVTLNPSKIRAKLNARVKRFITFEILYRMGKEEGYDKLPEVKNEIQMWKDYYLATMFRGKLLSKIKVTPSEAKEYYRQHYGKVINTKEVNIVEVLTDSLSVVEKVLNQLAKGADLHDLAVKYTKRKWTIKNRGEFGYFPVTMYGKIGATAARMKVGDIAGPIKVYGGYSIFKLLGVRKNKSKLQGDFKNLKDEIVKKLKEEKINKILINKTVELANKYGVYVNRSLFKSIKLKNFQMLVYRYFGFGGRMLAFPLSPDFHQWVKYWEKGKQNLP